ncbi:ABC transporter permease [Nocardia donostiensis]|uniref:ABC transporter permease n=1 Tax=Nocardia donostiensis TaxID=1538463 RepID=A0A1V2TJ89_9NOCA|nr:ABC transporter permease [Nocardia donostiensis]ONM49523.1 ABC transporter permease [Nocardia donostiensis]OQS13497.1 ABC transporter permease [Nocardia donostiensis]OQS17012.1 ABC transporter permease [Nocardia donostiensis]
MGVLAAERIKLTSTKSPWWCSAIVVALSLGFAALLAFVTRTASDTPEAGVPALTVDVATVGISGFGVMVLMIMAALTVTSEYRFGVIRTTFQAVPNRTKVLISKTALVGLYAAVLTTVLAFAAFAVAKAVGGPEASAPLVLEGNWRQIYAIPIYAFLCVAVAIGIGTLVRQSAAAISLIVLWMLLIEPLVGMLGSVGRQINAFLPFANATRFMSGPNGQGGEWHWGVWGSLIYFIAFTVIVFGAALLVVNRRDA